MTLRAERLLVWTAAVLFSVAFWFALALIPLFRWIVLGVLIIGFGDRVWGMFTTLTAAAKRRARETE